MMLMKRKTIRKGTSNLKETSLFLYGKLKAKNYAVAYCKLHKCYLEPLDIKEKKCNYKNCKFKVEV